jgi:hypothetical protein
MITLSTEELVGMINDVLPMASKNADDQEAHNIRLDVADEQLTLSATNRASAARVFWTPDYESYNEKAEEEGYAGEYAIDSDGPQHVRLSLRDAKSIASSFKLPTKLDFAPVSISIELASSVENLYKVKVTRKASLAWTPLTMHAAAEGRPLPLADGTDNGEINVDKLISLANPSTFGAISSPRAAFNPGILAPFAKVTRHGALKFWHSATNDGAPMYVEAGDRFTGMIYQASVDKKK